MKVLEKNKAIALRKQGESLGEIARILGVAKSSVSYWVRDIELTKVQRRKLNANGHSIDAIEKRRQARLLHTLEKRKKIMDDAASEILQLLKDPLWCIGVGLYWGEGGKTQQTARLSNSDPEVIKTIMRFFKKYSNVSLDKYRGHVHTFSNANEPGAVTYWSKVSGIPKKQFYKTYVKQSSASKKLRKTLPYGTFQVYVHESGFFFRLMGWIKAVKEMEG